MRRITDAFVIIAMLAGVVSVAHPAPVSAACGTFLTFPAWYRGLVDTGSCELKPIGNGGRSLRDFILIVAMNVFEMILQLVGYASVIFLMVGGFRYMTSAGDSNAMSAAKKTITNAIIGLVISILSVGLVNVVAGAI